MSWTPGQDRHLDLGADAVGRGHEHGLAVAGEVRAEHPAERPDLGEDLGVEGRVRQALDAGLGRVRGGDVDAGLAVVHGKGESSQTTRRRGASGRRGGGGKMHSGSHGARLRIRRPRAGPGGPAPEGGDGPAPARGAGAGARRSRPRSSRACSRRAKRLRPILSTAGRGGAEGQPRRGAARRLRDRDGPHREPDPRRPPSMDDAQTRRGRPTCHVAHGEATAVLAAFALLNRAYEILAEGWEGAPDAAARGGDRPRARARDRDGRDDRRPVEGPPDDGPPGRLPRPSSSSTAARRAPSSWPRPPWGALCAGAAVGGGVGRRLRQEPRPRLPDRRRPDRPRPGGAEAGKDVGKDLKKTTFVSFSGVEGAQALARELIAASEAALQPFGPRAEPCGSSPATSSHAGGEIHEPLSRVRDGPGAGRLRPRRGGDDQLPGVLGGAAGLERRPARGDAGRRRQ